MHDALVSDREVAVGEGEPAADHVHVDMRLDPVADLRGAREVGLELAVVSIGDGVWLRVVR